MIDTHAHLTFNEIWDNIDNVLLDCARTGIGQIVSVCLNHDDLEKIRAFSFDGLAIHKSAGIHPNDPDESDSFLSEVEKSAQNGEIVAVGEIGLDFFYMAKSREFQLRRFIRHLDIARFSGLPVLIHCRNAFDCLIKALDESYIGKPGALPGIIHCFCGNKQELLEIHSRGWVIGIGGAITYNRSVETIKALSQSPSSGYVLETDSPYLYPGKKRNQINTPASLKIIAEFVANTRGEDFSKVCADSTINAKRILPNLNTH